MDVLVTGSAGFVGRHLVAALESRGDHVMLCDPKHDHSWSGDCRELFEDSETRYDLVFHCAAEVGGRVGIDENAAHLGAVNLQLDGALWEWALRTRPGRVVYFSSAAVYPTYLQDRPSDGLHESWANPDAQGSPDESYGWAKLTGELMADRVRKAGVPVTVVRPFSMYGTDQDESEYPFPAFARRAARGDDPFVVWGDGTQVRDWLHIDDAVEAIFALVDAGVDGPVNLCTGIGTSMDHLACLAMACADTGDPQYAITDLGSRIRHLIDKPEGVRYRVGDPSLLNQHFTPRITVEEGMRRAVETVSARTAATWDEVRAHRAVWARGLRHYQDGLLNAKWPHNSDYA